MRKDITLAPPLSLTRGLLSPRLNVFLDVAVTLGVILDWVPSYMGVENSGTKLIVVPLIFFDLLRSNQKYVLNPFTWMYALAFLVGVGGSWLLGDTTQATLVSLLPTVLVFIFYAKPRSPEDHLRILRIMFYASLLVPLTIVLSWLGILQPKEVVQTAEFTRVIAAVSWSSLGLFTSIAPALLGGILLSLGSELKRGLPVSITAVVSLFIGLLGVILSAQRSAGMAFFLAFGLAGALLFFRVSAKQKFQLLFVFLVIAIGLSSIFPALDRSVAGSFLTRMSQTQSMGDVVRARMFDRFIYDISTQPRLIGPGSGVTYSDMRISNMHMIFAEAYYNGGLLFMIMLVLSFIWAGWNLFVRLIDRKYRSLYYVTSALLAMLAGSIIQLLTHPGLNIRLVYLLLGLCIAHVTLEKGDNDHSLSTPRGNLNDKVYRI